MKNKYAIVTGASTGIGRAITLELAKQNIFIALVARRKNKLDETKKIIEKEGGKAKRISQTSRKQSATYKLRFV